MKKATNKQPKIYDKIRKEIIALLDKNIVPWEQPWIFKQESGDLHNPSTKTVYRGFNVFWLGLHMMKHNLTDTRFLTYKNVKDLGGKVRKGFATEVTFYNQIPVFAKDENGKFILDENGQKIIIRKVPVFGSHTVWNVEHCDGLDLPELTKIDIPEFDAVEIAETVANDYLERENITLNHISQNEAFYSPSYDAITMPKKDQFKSQLGYYNTLFHELGHSTGHESRLDRKKDLGKSQKFGDMAYAKEELVAEFCSSFVNAHLGIKSVRELEQNASYIDSWKKHIKDDPRSVITGADRGTKAANLILNINQDKE